MLRATTLTQVGPGDSSDTGDPSDYDTGDLASYLDGTDTGDLDSLLGTDETGDLGSLLGSAVGIAGSALGGQGGTLGTIGQLAGGASSLLGGGGGAASGGGNPGSAIGGMAGGALGTMLGPVGTMLGGAAGSALGGALGGLLGGHHGGRKPSAPSGGGRPHQIGFMSSSERGAWDAAVTLSNQLKSSAPRDDAWMRIWDPPRYALLSQRGLAPMQVYQTAQAKAKAAKLERERVALVAKEKVEHDLLFQGMSASQRSRLDAAIKKGRGPMVYRQILTELAAVKSAPAFKPPKLNAAPPAPPVPSVQTATAPTAPAPSSADIANEAANNALARILDAMSAQDGEGPEDDDSAGPEDDDSAGPEDDDSAGPEDDDSAGPEDDSAGPGDEHETGDLGSLLGSAAGLAGSALGGQGGALGTIGQLAGGASSLLGGGGGGAPSGGGNPGSAIGGIAGGALGTMLGPVGTMIGGAAGSALGGAIGGLLGGKKTGRRASAPNTPTGAGRPHQIGSMSSSERGLWDAAVTLSSQLKSQAPRDDTWMRIWDPPRYAQLSQQGQAPMQLYRAAKAERERVALVAKEKAEHALLFQGMSASQRARLEAAIKVNRGPTVYRQILTELATTKIAYRPRFKAPTLRAPSPPAAPSPPPPSAADLANTAANDAIARVLNAMASDPTPPSASSLAPTMYGRGDDDEDSAGPGEEEDVGVAIAARPRPKRHIALIPLQKHQLAAMLRAVPPLQKLDRRSLQLLSGRTSVAHDVGGVDPGTRTYHPDPGETATGIARQLTGTGDRSVELVAANPGHREGDPWRIPPGWLVFNRDDDTGAITTQRKYIVQSGDFPMQIAQNFGATATHPAWWHELKAANPDKAVVDGGANWAQLIAGEEIGIPDSWPSSPLSFPNGNVPTPSVPSPIPGAPPLQLPIPAPGGMAPFPGFPPANATQDAGVMLQAQGLLAFWSQQHPGSCTPPDFGKTIADFTGTTTPRTTQATQSFQLWWNQANPLSPLRMDGVLDDPTDKALFASSAAQIPKPMPLPTPALPSIPSVLPSPAPTPQLPQAQNLPQLPQLLPSSAPSSPGSQAPGLPPGWSWPNSNPAPQPQAQPQSPFSMPWQIPATPPPGDVSPTWDDPAPAPQNARATTSEGDLAPVALALAMGLSLL